jgi:hypothetical protein
MRYPADGPSQELLPRPIPQLQVTKSNVTPYPHPQPPGPETQTVHELRSSFRYQSLSEEHVPRPFELSKAFKRAYTPFMNGLPVPKEALEELSKFTLTSAEY